MLIQTDFFLLNQHHYRQRCRQGLGQRCKVKNGVGGHWGFGKKVPETKGSVEYTPVILGDEQDGAGEHVVGDRLLHQLFDLGNVHLVFGFLCLVFRNRCLLSCGIPNTKYQTQNNLNSCRPVIGQQMPVCVEGRFHPHRKCEIRVSMPGIQTGNDWYLAITKYITYDY